MTEEQKNARRDFYYSKSIKELVDMLVEAEEELQEAKDLRRRIMQIRNIATPKDERRPQGRPKKEANL